MIGQMADILIVCPVTGRTVATGLKTDDVVFDSLPEIPVPVRWSAVSFIISSILGFIPAPFMGVYASTKHAIEGLSESLDHEVRAFGIRVVLIEPHYIRTNLDASAAQAEGRIDAYAAQRRRTAAAITHNTNTAPEPKVVAEEVLRAIEGSYRMRRPIGQAVLLSWLRKLLPARMFEPSLRKGFALDPSSKGAVTQPRTQP